MAQSAEYSWRTLSMSESTYEYLRRQRKPKESMDAVLRRLLGLPEATGRPRATRQNYWPGEARK